MASATQVSIDEYLSTTYRPDCDYVDGEVVERNVGESDDSMGRIMERIEDYFPMGVPHVGVIDPWRGRAYHYTPDGMHEPKDGVLRTSNPELALALAAVCP